MFILMTIDFNSFHLTFGLCNISGPGCLGDARDVPRTTDRERAEHSHRRHHAVLLPHTF